MEWENIIFTLGILFLFAVGTSLALYMQSKNLKKEWDLEDKGSSIQGEQIKEQITGKSNNDILKITFTNLAELKEYYEISKAQARKAFSGAMTFSTIGVAILFLGILMVIFFGKIDIAIVSAVGTIITNCVAGLFFWLYNQSIKQLNLYHNSLRTLERYLVATNIASEISSEGRDSVLEKIIEAMLKLKTED